MKGVLINHSTMVRFSLHRVMLERERERERERGDELVDAPPPNSTRE